MDKWEELTKQIADAVGSTNTDEAPDEVTNVLLPIVKRMLPSIMAQEIVGVQPMAGVPKLTVGTAEGIEHPYWVDLPNSPGAVFNIEALDRKQRERTDWCLETFADDDWMASSFKFYFRNEKDRDWFVMRWS